MAYTRWAIAAAAAVGVGALSTGLQAAPLGNTKVRGADAALQIDRAASHCWWSHGRRHCGYGYRYGYRYREHGYPENYRTGSGRWWREMDREDRGGRGGRN
jgi:hypothetical protein